MSSRFGRNTLVLVVLALYTVFVNSRVASDDRSKLEETAKREPLSPLSLVERVVSLDSGDQRISSDAGDFLIETPEIISIADYGPSVLPMLLDVMGDERLSFDTFVRCYGVYSRIVGNEHPDRPSVWGTGLCRVVRTPVGGGRIKPGTQFDERAFRRRLLEAVKSEFRELFIKSEGTGKNGSFQEEQTLSEKQAKNRSVGRTGED